MLKSLNWTLSFCGRKFGIAFCKLWLNVGSWPELNEQYSIAAFSKLSRSRYAINLTGLISQVTCIFVEFKKHGLFNKPLIGDLCSRYHWSRVSRTSRAVSLGGTATNYPFWWNCFLDQTAEPLCPFWAVKEVLSGVCVCVWGAQEQFAYHLTTIKTMVGVYEVDSPANQSFRVIVTKSVDALPPYFGP